MRKPKKALCFCSDLYHQEFYFLNGWTRDQVEKDIGIDSSGAQGLTINKNGKIYIWVEDINGHGLSHLAHESVHAANFTLGSRGVKVSADDDEAQAYLVQWIFQHCYVEAKKKLKK